MKQTAKQIKEQEVEQCLRKEIRECKDWNAHKRGDITYIAMYDPPGTTRLEIIANLLAR